MKLAKTLAASFAFAATLASAFAAAAGADMTEAEVRKVDAASGKVTLKHGEIRNLDMPPMTMVFTAPDKSLLQGLKEGDKVRFAAEKQGGTYVVTAIRKAE